MRNLLKAKDYIPMLNVYFGDDYSIDTDGIKTEEVPCISLICIEVLLKELKYTYESTSWIHADEVCYGLFDPLTDTFVTEETFSESVSYDDKHHHAILKPYIDTRLYYGIGAILDKVFESAESTYGEEAVRSFINRYKELYNAIMVVKFGRSYEWGTLADYESLELLVDKYLDDLVEYRLNTGLLKMMKLLIESIRYESDSLLGEDAVLSTLVKKDMLILVRKWLHLPKNHDRWSFTADTSAKNFTISQRSDIRRRVVDCLVKVNNPKTKKQYFTLILDSKTNHMREKTYDAIMDTNIYQLFYDHVKYAVSHPDTNIYSFLFYTIFNDCDVVRYLSNDEDSIRCSDTELVFAKDSLTDVYKYGVLWSYHTDDNVPITDHMYDTIDTLFTRLFEMNNVELKG